MLSIHKTASAITFRFSSELQLVDQVVEAFEKYCSRLKVEEPSSLILVLKELLINAVVHGSQNDANRNVLCVVEKLEKSRFMIQVEDTGRGFAYKSIDMNPPEDLKHIQKRGYAIINALSDRIEFNDSGNKVTVFLAITKGMGGVL
ncbi:MAG: ATP-binding protein [Deltaproteobacteria bacterium]|nr:ATP-binding protein [Deltaproteobacteria bacterium]